MERPDQHPPTPAKSVGVLLVNLGTPDAPTTTAVRRYLAEFLSDRRVVEMPRLLWLPILYGPILTFRAPKTAHAYQAIWDKDTNKSPLRLYTERQQMALIQKLSDLPDIAVRHAFRYGNPSIKAELTALKEAGCDRILIAPLYPQYSATTTGSVMDAVGATLAKMRWQPAIRTLPPYFDNPAHINALATSLQTGLEALNFVPDAVFASYHSIPAYYWQQGDPYPCQCFKTSRLLNAALADHLPAEGLQTCFQSRLGPTKWVGPYTLDSVVAAARAGKKKIAILSPAFASDCLETLEELNIALRDAFLEAGGTDFAYIPCLNDSDAGMAMLDTLIRQELQGWVQKPDTASS